jgi:hypothetical protein
MSAGNSLKPMPMIVVNSGILNAVTFTKITTGNGLAHAPVMIHVVSRSSDDIELSFDGVTAHDLIVSGQSFLFTQQGSTPPNNICLLPKGTHIYLRLLNAPGAGLLYFATYYQQ